MKALFVSFNLNTFAPSSRYVNLLFKSCFKNIDYFGPGFVSEDILKKGLTNFVKRNGKYDIAMTTYGEKKAFVNVKKEKKYINSHSTFKNDLALMLSTFNKIVDDFWSLKTKKIAAPIYDTYATGEKTVEFLTDLDGYIMHPFSTQFIIARKEFEDMIKIESAKFGAHNSTDNWYHFINSYEEKIIPFPHFVTETEFDFTPIAFRKFDWYSPGTQYLHRANANRIIKEKQFKKPNEFPLKILRYWRRIFSKETNNRIRFFNGIFRDNIADTMAVFTCVGIQGSPIRKFFEIPALGAVLVCVPFTGFEDAGFKNGLNAITCTTDEIPKIHHYLKENPIFAQKIASAGRELVWEKHSLSARATQMRKVFESICNNRYKKSYWKDGQFVIEEKEK